jgi:hypothetical protein
MHQREHIVIVRRNEGNDIAHDVLFNEIRAAESVPTDKVEVKDQEKKLRNN